MHSRRLDYGGAQAAGVCSRSILPVRHSTKRSFGCGKKKAVRVGRTAAGWHEGTVRTLSPRQRFLEAHLSIQLQNASRDRGTHERAIRAGRTSHGALDDTKGGGRRDVVNRVCEIGVIEHVIGCRPNSKVQPFLDSKVLSQSEVAVEVVRTAEKVPALVSKTNFRSRRSELRQSQTNVARIVAVSRPRPA